MSDQKTPPTKGPRWACPECGSTKVQISLPAWHTEEIGGHIAYVESDEEAEVMAWACVDDEGECLDSGIDQPVDLTEHDEDVLERYAGHKSEMAQAQCEPKAFGDWLEEHS